MLWIKRNLFLAVGGLLAAGLLAVGILYILQGTSRSAELDSEVADKKEVLKKLYSEDPFPNDANIKAAKNEAARLQQAGEQAKKFFVPVHFDRSVTGVAFRTMRDNILADLNRNADSAGVKLGGIPGRPYAFSFDVQKNKTDFKAGTFPAIPGQMAEVRALCGILYAAKVHKIENIRRAKVSEDDAQGNPADYHNQRLETNPATGAIVSPYEVTVHCTSSELESAMGGLWRSTNGFVLKAIHVEPVAGQDGATPAAGGSEPTPARPNPRLQPPPRGSNRGNIPVVPAARPAGDKAVHVLKEKQLKVTMLIYATKSAGR